MAMMRDGSAQSLLTVHHKKTTPLTVTEQLQTNLPATCPKCSLPSFYMSIFAHASIFKFILFVFPASLLILHDVDWHGAQPGFPSIIRGAHLKNPGITEATGSPHG